ncbi:MAG: polyprenyl synthetase family protein [Deltaproteobacteria bacterium]|nr:polyprenyl synthetase family protein [Deltaproteobacteria bacterium]
MLARRKPEAEASPRVLRSLQATCNARGLAALAERIADLDGFIHDDLMQIEGVLRNIKTPDDVVGRSAQHLLARGGKRLRPLCVGLSSRLGAGGFNAAARELAVAVELIHNATLLHDDVVDLGDRRRGHETARVVFGNAASIYSGDWLLIEALRRVHSAEVPGVLVRLLSTIDEMIAGEALQLARRDELVVDRDVYFRVIEGKTASLFRWATYAGARAGLLDEDEAECVGRYGENLGLAFQMIDDALDLKGDVSVVGKDLLADVREGKVTYPLLVMLEAEPALAGAIEQMAGSGVGAGTSRNTNTNTNTSTGTGTAAATAMGTEGGRGEDEGSSAELETARQEILAALERTQAIEVTMSLARDYAQRACKNLETLAPSLARSALEAVSEALVLRDR